MRRSSVIFPGAIALLAAWAVLQTAGWPIKTALYPRVVGVPLLILAVAETVLSARGKEEIDSAGPVDVTPTKDIPPRIAARRTAAVAAWMVGFYAAILLIGFPRAVPLFVAAYLGTQARAGWVASFVLAGFAWLAFSLLFIRLLHLPFAEGLIWSLLTR